MSILQEKINKDYESAKINQYAWKFNDSATLPNYAHQPFRHDSPIYY